MNAYTYFIVTNEEVSLMMTAAMVGHSDSRRVLAQINGWLGEAKRRPKARRFMCATCDTTFDGSRRRSPAGFLVAFPTFEDGLGVTTGICAKCCAVADHADMALKWVRNLWPDAQVHCPGNA